MISASFSWRAMGSARYLSQGGDVSFEQQHDLIVHGAYMALRQNWFPSACSLNACWLAALCRGPASLCRRLRFLPFQHRGSIELHEKVICRLFLPFLFKEEV